MNEFLPYARSVHEGQTTVALTSIAPSELSLQQHLILTLFDTYPGDTRTLQAEVHVEFQRPAVLRHQASSS